MHGRYRQDAIDRVIERLPWIDGIGAARLQTEKRRNGLQVVLHPVVDFLSEDTAHDRPPVLERDGGMVGDRPEERALLVRERRVAVAHELPDLPALPAERHADRV